MQASGATTLTVALAAIVVTLLVMLAVTLLTRNDEPPRPGHLERRPNGSDLAPWGAEPQEDGHDRRAKRS